ncbi:PiggyBac transposable element-derived protein 4 [Anthophora retusa]
MVVWNAYCLYQSSTATKLPFAKFHLNLIRQILETYGKQKSDMKCLVTRNSNNVERLTERHFSSVYSNKAAKKKNQIRKCVVCSKQGKRRESRYYCSQCDVGLCMVPCFELYHTKVDY